MNNNRVASYPVLLAFLCMIQVSCRLEAQESPVEKSYRACESYQGSAIKTIVGSRNPFLITVSSQEDLDNMSTNIRKAINSGKKDVEVQIGPGVFYYDRLPIYLYNINASEVSISIKGNNSIMVAGGRDYSKGRKVSAPTKNNVYLDKDLKLIDLYGEVMQLRDQVAVLDTNSKECRIDIDKPINFVPGMEVQISEWFHSPVYGVTKTNGRSIFFVADDLAYDKAKKCYNVNYDQVGKLNPRIRFVDPRNVTNFKGSVHECEASQFLTLYRMNLKCFVVSGITFCGCAKGKEALFHIRDVDAEQIRISDCKFENLNQRIIKLKNTGNFVFCNNTVTDCFYGVLYSDIDCPKTVVQNNRFYRAEKGWTNTSCVACYGQDFLIANNQFEDISYASIVTGYHHKWGDKMVCRGIIENNEIFFGEEYSAYPEKYSLIDGGAIYIGTLNDKVIVRYNYIHNYRGVNSNRAIYCDEGAMNVKIYGNVIAGVTNAYSVFSWRAKSVNKKYPQSNDGIDFYYNVIWGEYKFDERPNSSCVHGKNLILYGEEEQMPTNSLLNFAYQEEDVVVPNARMEDGKIGLSPEGVLELKRLPTYPNIKQWFYDTNSRPIKIRL